MFRNISFRRWLLLMVAVGWAQSVEAETSRWGDFAAELDAGSLEFALQKRLVKSPDSPDCPACVHYLELRVGRADVDEIDVSHRILGYRYYTYHDEDVWATYIGAGVGRYRLDPGETHSGWNVRVGVDIALTDSCSKKRPGKLRSAIFDWETNLTHHTVERPGSDLSYLHLLTGIRIVRPSKNDKKRAQKHDLCKRENNGRDYEPSTQSTTPLSKSDLRAPRASSEH